MNAYCVSCKEQREMDNARAELAKNGRHMMKGECSSCGTKMCKFVSENTANGGGKQQKKQASKKK